MSQRETGRIKMRGERLVAINHFFLIHSVDLIIELYKYTQMSKRTSGPDLTK